MLDQLKINNLTNILTCIFSRTVATKAELVQYTELSSSTVSSSVNSLLKLKLLVCDGMREPIGGRPSKIYRLNKDYGYFIGVDMSLEKLTLCVADCENGLVETRSRSLDQAQTVIENLFCLLDEVAGQRQDVLGIGIGIPGLLDHKEQIVLKSEPFGWNHVHLKEILERRYTVFSYLDHRVNGAAFRESILGAAGNEQNYLCVYESAPEKAALVIDGQICRGACNHIGELGGISLPALVEHGLLSFMNIPEVVVGYRTEEFRRRMEESVSRGAARVVCIPDADHSLALGMAAAAQQRWFKSIYFML